MTLNYFGNKCLFKMHIHRKCNYLVFWESTVTGRSENVSSLLVCSPPLLFQWPQQSQHHAKCLQSLLSQARSPLAQRWACRWEAGAGWGAFHWTGMCGSLAAAPQRMRNHLHSHTDFTSWNQSWKMVIVLSLGSLKASRGVGIIQSLAHWRME